CTCNSNSSRRVSDAAATYPAQPVGVGRREVALNDVMFHIRWAHPHYFQALVAFDQIAQADPQRSAQLQHAISANLCYVAIQGGRPIAYAVLTSTCFARALVD